MRISSWKPCLVGFCLFLLRFECFPHGEVLSVVINSEMRGLYATEKELVLHGRKILQLLCL